MNELKLFTPQEIDPTLAISILGGLALIIFLIVYGTYRYRRFKKFQEFVEEMNLLGFDDEQENTLTQLVKRYAMEEPVQVLLSKRAFDELAAKEINRILGSPGSIVAKQEFINKVYEIRRKTYNEEWSSNLEDDAEEDPPSASINGKEAVSSA